MSEKKKILWVDSDHMYLWDGVIDYLNKQELDVYKLEEIGEIDDMIKACDEKSMLIWHGGTYTTPQNLISVLTSVKNYYPNMKIALQTNVIHPLVKERDLVDFMIGAPIDMAVVLKIILEKLG